MKLTHHQLAALAEFQRRNGRGWKYKLRFCWESGLWAAAAQMAPLQQLRNQLGPVWLNAYKTGDEQVGWLHPAMYEAPNGAEYGWRRGWKIAWPDGRDMIQPYCRTKTEARELARSLKITLIED